MGSSRRTSVRSCPQPVANAAVVVDVVVVAIVTIAEAERVEASVRAKVRAFASHVRHAVKQRHQHNQ
jgi:hypothetical protein